MKTAAKEIVKVSLPAASTAKTAAEKSKGAEVVSTKEADSVLTEDVKLPETQAAAKEDDAKTTEAAE